MRVPFVDPIEMGHDHGPRKGIPHFWWCIILIATANQGITPDPQDLASQKLLQIILPISRSDFEATGEDESVANVCEPLQMDQGSRIRQVANKIPLPGQVAIRTCSEIFSPDLRRVASHNNEDMRPHGLMHALVRLRC